MTGLRVIALDLSLTSTGIAATHASTGDPGLYCVTPPSPRSAKSPNVIDHGRLHTIFQAIKHAVAFSPDLVVIEWQPKVDGTGDASLRIAELHGAIKHWLWAHKLTYVDVRPQELKTYATGKGNARKDLVRHDVMARYSKCATITGHDQADAFALLALALDAYGQPLAEVPQSHRVAVGRVTWPTLTAVAA